MIKAYNTGVFKVYFLNYFFPAKYYLYDNYFDLPGALLCARVVDSLDQVRTGLFENYVLHYLFLPPPYLLHALLNTYKLDIEQHQGLFLIWTIPCST